MSGITTTILRIMRGDTGEWSIAVTNAAGSATPCTGAAAIFTLRPGYPAPGGDDASATFQAKTADAVNLVWVSDSAGTLTLIIPAATSATLGFDQYVGDLQIRSAAGKVYTAASILLLVDQREVTLT